jgi:hypothetical protein
VKDDKDLLQLFVREAIGRAIPEDWLNGGQYPERLAAVMIGLIDASVCIAVGIWGKEGGVERISKLVNSAIERVNHG